MREDSGVSPGRSTDRRDRLRDVDLRGTILFRLARVGRILRRALSRDQARYGLYNGRDLVLIEIVRRGGAARPLQIQKELGLAPSNLTGILRRTQRAGYATRAPDPRDGRTYLAGVTRTGELCAQLMAEAWKYHDRRVLQALTASERAELLRLLRKVEGVLEQIAAEEAAGG